MLGLVEGCTGNLHRYNDININDIVQNKNLKGDRPSAKRNNSSVHSVFFQALFC
jgi:hypothetical protein